MTIALAKTLVTEGLVPAARMDDILQRQVLFGGSVDTNLLEAGVLDEASLTRALAQVHRLPAATGKLLAARDERVRKLFPARLAQKYQVVPVSMSGRSLILLAAGRVHPVVEDEIGFMLSLSVKTHLVCEARLKQLLRDWLHLEIEPRYETLAGRLEPLEKVFPSEQKAAPESAPESAPGAPKVPSVDEGLVEKAIHKLEDAEREDREKRRRARQGALSLEEARKSCLEVDRREDLVDIILRFARQFMPYVGLFVLHDEHIQGWDAVGDEDAGKAIRMVRLPVASPSVLRTVLRTQAYYLGALPDSGVNDDLMRMLGRDRPRNVLIVPILVQGRVIGMVYGDGGRRSIRGRRVSDLLVFVSGLSGAFEQLIRKRKLAKGDAPAQEEAPLQEEAPVQEEAPLQEEAPALEQAEPEPEPEAPEEPPAQGLQAPAPLPAPSQESRSNAAAVPAQVHASQQVPTPVDPLSGGRSAAAGSDLMDEVVGAEDADMPTPVEDEPGDALMGAEAPDEPGQAVVLDESFGDLDDDNPVIEADALGFPEVQTQALDETPGTTGIRSDETRVEIEDLADGEGEMSYAVVDGEAGDVVVVDTDGSFAPEPKLVSPPPVALLEPEDLDRELLDEDEILVGGEVGLATARSADGLPGMQELKRFERRLPSLLNDLVSGDQERMDLARVEILPFGKSALPKLMELFPGHLNFDVRGHHDAVPPLREHGPLLRLLLEMGQEAIRAVADRLEDDEPLARYYAVRFFGEMRDGGVVPRLATRLYDRDALVRLSAIDVLLSYRNSDHFQTLLKNLRHRLQSTMPDQQAIAAALLGNFKDRGAVEELIDLVKAPEKIVARASMESLSYITKQDFGRSQRKWRKWYKAHKDESRVAWLIAGLRSKSRDVRFSAYRELTEETGQHLDYNFDGSKSEREKAARRWLDWWETSGRSTEKG